MVQKKISFILNIEYMYGVVFSIHLGPQFSHIGTCNFVLTFGDVMIRSRIIAEEILF